MKKKTAVLTLNRMQDINKANLDLQSKYKEERKMNINFGIKQNFVAIIVQKLDYDKDTSYLKSKNTDDRIIMEILHNDEKYPEQLGQNESFPPL